MGKHVSIAARNGPSNTVLSGDSEHINELNEKLIAAGINTTFLQVSHAFHSHHMDEVITPLNVFADQLISYPSNCHLISNQTVQEMNSIPKTGYWGEHLRGCVRFNESIMKAYDMGCRVFIEVGPDATLSTLGRYSIDKNDAHFLSSLKRKTDPWINLSASVVELYQLGQDIDFKAYHGAHQWIKTPLPCVSYNRKKYWLDQQMNSAPLKASDSMVSTSNVQVNNPNISEFIRQQLNVMDLQLDMLG
jgi:acyl transferase domain-containing protein